MKRITLADVARRAGVHTTTVSRAMRNHPTLPEETRLRLQELAHEMGYVPDPALAALMAYRRRGGVKPREQSIAYITNWYTAKGWTEMPAHAQFFEGAHAKAAALGYGLEHFWLGERNLTAARLSDILYHRGVTGLILASHRFRSDVSVDLDWRRFCAVKIDYYPLQVPISTVSNDQLAIIQLAVRKSLAAGYHRIGLVLDDVFDTAAHHAWSAGFLAEQLRIAEDDRIPILRYVTDGGTPEPSNPIQPIDGTSLAPWFRQHRPEVIISYGRPVRPTLRDIGVRVPKDVAFVELFVESEDGSMAGVRENCFRVGEVAVEVLVSSLHQNSTGIPPIATSTLVEGTWIDGASLPPQG
ncbi:MAG TPA: LacI family DNA-binding transcriptional regulator [Opitutaceae bacterium]|jgi:LacI family transcriptional regulator